MHGPRDIDLVQLITVLHPILIPLSLLVVLPVISSAVCLSVGPFSIAVKFSASVQLLGRGFWFR